MDIEQRKRLEKDLDKQFSAREDMEPGTMEHQRSTEDIKMTIEAITCADKSEAEVLAKQAETKRQTLEPWLSFGANALNIAAGCIGTLFSAKMFNEATKAAIKYSETGVFEMIPKQIVTTAITGLMKGKKR